MDLLRARTRRKLGTRGHFQVRSIARWTALPFYPYSGNRPLLGEILWESNRLSWCRKWSSNAIDVDLVTFANGDTQKSDSDGAHKSTLVETERPLEGHGNRSAALIAVRPSFSTIRCKALNIFIKVCYSLPCTLAQIPDPDPVEEPITPEPYSPVMRSFHLPR